MIPALSRKILVCSLGLSRKLQNCNVTKFNTYIIQQNILHVHVQLGIISKTAKF